MFLKVGIFYEVRSRLWNGWAVLSVGLCSKKICFAFMIKPDIQAAFFDVDGTLLSFEKHMVPDSTQESLAELHRRGIKIFIATGRSATNLDEISMLPYEGVIGLNGTSCVLRDGSVVSRHAIPHDVFIRFMELAERYDVAVSVEGDSGVFVNRLTERVEEMSRMVNLPLPQIRDLTQVFVPGETSQLCLFADRQIEAEIMSQLPLLSSSRWCDLFADLNVAGFDKGSGLYEMARHYGFRLSSVIAFGDGGNDIPMLRTAGIGVAMGNAGDSVKRSADFVTRSVDDDGIKYALQHFGVL